MAGNPVLSLAGSAQALLFKLPVVGEPLVRGFNTLLGNIAFRAPILGASRQTNMKDIMDAWSAFLNKNGIEPSIDEMTETECHWSVDFCPYGYDKPHEHGVCDAVMDLDRAYIRALGGEMTILDRIPDGSPRCRFVTKLQK